MVANRRKQNQARKSRDILIYQHEMLSALDSIFAIDGGTCKCSRSAPYKATHLHPTLGVRHSLGCLQGSQHVQQRGSCLNLYITIQLLPDSYTRLLLLTLSCFFQDLLIQIHHGSPNIFNGH